LITQTISDKEKLSYYREEMSDQEYFEYRKEIKKKGYHLGIKDLVIVDPTYLIADIRRKKTPIRYIKSEKAESSFNKQIAKSVGLKSTILSDADIYSGSIIIFDETLVL